MPCMFADVICTKISCVGPSRVIASLSAVGSLMNVYIQHFKPTLTFTLCILVDFPINVNTISMGLPIVYFRGSYVEFSKL